MPTAAVSVDFVVIFFIYGLAFFSMGLAMYLESGRSPLLAQGRVLRPLALFGLVHGVHEWIELGLLLSPVLGFTPSPLYEWLRLGILALSFSLLLVFGLRVLRPEQMQALTDTLASVLVLLMFVVVSLVAGLMIRNQHADWLGHLDALARYSLAVPGAALAGLALSRQLQQMPLPQRQRLRLPLNLAALSFGLYAISQLFVQPLDFFPANWLNTVALNAWLGIPVQVLRAAAAVGITTGLIRSSQIVEQERSRQFLDAQMARLEALEGKRRELAEREALRRKLLRHTVIAQEDERSRIARELHDETAQVLTAFSLTLATLKDVVEHESKAGQLLLRMQSLCQQMSQGLYRMVHDLRPAQLDDLGLVAALQHLCDEERRRSGLHVELHVRGARTRLDPLVETVFFRVAQEALTNVARHAGVQQAEVELRFAPDEIQLRIIDRGCGFDPKAELSPPKGWGLAGMRERTESIGGWFDIISAPERGTTVEVMVPTTALIESEEKIEANGYHPLNVGR